MCISSVLLCLASSGNAQTLSVTNGLAMQLEASSGVTADPVTGLVSYWSDQSTNGHDAFQIYQGNQPLLVTNGTVSGGPVVRMDGSSSMLTLVGQVLTSPTFSIFAVVNATPSDTGNHELFGNWSGAAGNTLNSVYFGITLYTPTSDSATVRFTDAHTVAGLTIGNSSDYILEAINGASMSMVAQDGVTLFTGTPITGRVLTANPNTGPYTIGDQGDPNHGYSVGEYWAGDIAALLVYNRELTSAEQTQVQQYLQNKFLEPAAPQVIAITPATNSVLNNLTSVGVTFSEPVTNVNAVALQINGSPATSVTAISTRQYLFQFPQPPGGTCTVGFSATNGITDLASSPNALAGTTWNYTLVNTNPPTLVVIEPPAGMTVRTLNSIRLFFDEPVTNVNTAVLLINGSPIATNVIAYSTTEYEFFFPQPANGAVNVAFAANQDIIDASRLPFGGGSWSYTLNSNAPFALAVQYGLAMQLEASSGVSADQNGYVSYWSDQSTNGHDAFAGAGNREPLLIPNGSVSGGPVLRLDGSTSVLTVVGQVLTSQDFTILAVVNATPSDSGNHELFGNWSGWNMFTSLFVGITGYNTVSDNATARFTDQDALAGTLLAVSHDYVVDYMNQAPQFGNLGFSSVAQDGITIFTTVALPTRNLASDPNVGPYTIGAQGNPDYGYAFGEYWAGDIAALLVYNRTLTSPELAQVRQYLQDKFLEPAAPTLVAITPATNSTVRSLTSVAVTFSEPVGNVNAAALQINGSPATSVTAISARQYSFQFPQPPAGTCTVGFSATNGITDLASSPNALAGTTWNYTLASSIPPHATIEPAAGMTVGTLNSIRLFFDEPVTNVNAAVLLINGSPATNVIAYSTTEYEFFFPQPAFGVVNVAFAANQDIIDASGNLFGGGSWSYTLNSNAPFALTVQYGLALRLEASSGVTADTNGLVSYWSDQSTNGHDAFQSDPGKQPLLVTNATVTGGPVVRLNGNTDLMTLVGQVLTSQTFSIFAVVNAIPSDTGNHEIFGNWSGAAGNFGTSVYLGITGYDSASNSARIRFTDADGNAGTATEISADFILEAISGASMSMVAQDGVTLFTGSPLSFRNLTSNPTNAPYTIGVQGDPDHGWSAGEYWPGGIAELLVYNRELTSAEQTQVEQYLNGTYLGTVQPSIVSLSIKLALARNEYNLGGTNSLIVLEAVDYNVASPSADATHNWVFTTTPTNLWSGAVDINFSAAGVMEAQPNVGVNEGSTSTAGPELSYVVNFTSAGTYYVWMRGIADSPPGPSVNDSVLVGLDGAITTAIGNSGWTTNAGFYWDGAANVLAGSDAIVITNTGPHVINVWMREDGFDFDKLVLTTNANYTPTDVGPAKSPATNEISISWPQAGNAGFTLQSTTNVLGGTWTNMGPATIVGGQYNFNEPLGGSAKFYRLVK